MFYTVFPGVQKPNTQASLDPDVPNEEDTQLRKANPLLIICNSSLVSYLDEHGAFLDLNILLEFNLRFPFCLLSLINGMVLNNNMVLSL